MKNLTKLIIIGSLTVLTLFSYFFMIEDKKVDLQKNNVEKKESPYIKKYNLNIDTNNSCFINKEMAKEDNISFKAENKSINKIEDTYPYEEPPVEGKEPKWRFAKVNVSPMKYGSSTVLYNKCSGCHGKLGNTNAMGKSKLLSKMSTDTIILKLKAYRDNNLNQYGMGRVMQKEVAKMSNEDFISLANQINGLK